MVGISDLLLTLILVATFMVTALIWREVREYRRQVKELGEGIKKFIRASAEREFKQTEALISLLTTMDLKYPLPPSRGWAASPDLLLLLYRLTLEQKPTLIVECGSGLSTVVLAKAASTYGGRLVSLDHDPAYCQATQAEVERQGLSAEIRLAPLTSTPHGTWYDPAVVADLAGIELLFIDGPPAGTGEMARYPALPLIWERCSPAVRVVLDDTSRKDEREIGERWASEFGLTALPIGLEKGAFLLSKPAEQEAPGQISPNRP